MSCEESDMWRSYVYFETSTVEDFKQTYFLNFYDTVGKAGLIRRIKRIRGVG